MPHIKCAFFREDKNIIKISFRSKDDFDVNKFARTHFMEEGILMYRNEDSLEDAIENSKNIHA